MNDSKKILLVGSSNMDLVINLCRVPDPGETLLDDGGIAYLPGGKGANAAVAFAKLGAECVFCTKVGADVHGQKLFDYYRSQGVNVSHVLVDSSAPTGLATVMKEANGQNRIVVFPGANARLNADNVQSAFACRPDALYLGFEIPFATALSAAKTASSMDIPIFIDAAPADRNFPLESLPHVEIFSPNESETLEFTGILPAGATSCLQAAISLFRRVNCRFLVIKLGERGSFIYDGKHYSMIPAFRPDRVADTTAAGDAFTAAMTFSYLKTGDISTAVRYGTAAGAVTVSREGASVSVPTAAEVEEILRRSPY